MNSTVTIDTSMLDRLINSIENLRFEVSLLRKSRVKKVRYGSDEWWRQSTEKAMDDMKNGRFTTLESTKDIDKFFASL